MPTSAPEKVIEKVPAELICESCGAKFSCGAKIGRCWCFDVKTTAENSTAWRGRFDGCLCESCLMQPKKHDVPECDNSAAKKND